MQRRNPLGVSIGRRQTGVDHTPVPVLHQGVPHEGELGVLAGPFAIEPRIRIAGRGVRLVRAALLMKIYLPVRLSNRFTRDCARTPLNSLAAMSPSNSRSRFLENVE
jgi:hypothetical protein